MLAARTERARPARCWFLHLSVLMVLARGVSALGQSAAPEHPDPAARPSILPKACLEQSHPSEKITALLEAIHDHPTAGAYNTVGVLYAQGDRVWCAIKAFETAIKLEDPNWEAHYNLAIALISKGDQTEATRELRTAIQQKPDSVSSHFALGNVLEDERKLGEAEEQFRSSLKLDPSFAPGALKLSEVLIAERKQHAAVDCLEEALRQNPSADQAGSLKAALGLAYAENGEGEKGLATLRNLVTAEPNSAGAHFNLGLLSMRKGQPTDREAAATEFREALRLDDSMNGARIALGRVLNSLGKYSEAIPALVEYTRRAPKDAQGFNVLGKANQGLEKPEAAMGAFQRAAALDPKDATIRFDLGTLLARTGQTDAGIRELEAAERINPSDIETHKQLALLLEKAGNKERARVERAKLAALKASSDRDRDVARLNEQANQFLMAGNVKAAAENYRKAAQSEPLDAKLHYNLSLALDRLADIAAERKELLRAVELDPSLALAQNQLGLLALHGGQQAEAEIRFQKALEADPEFAEAQSNLGVLYSQQGKNADAATRFQNAINTDPKYSKAYVNYGLLFAQQGALPEAEQQLRAAIQVNSNDADGYGALGMLLAKTGRGDDALQYFRKAVILQPASAQAHLNLGIALVDKFDRPGGFEEFSEAARLDPKLAAAHYNLGRFYFETGKYEDADRELETAARLQSDSAATLYFLALTAKQENQPERSNELLERVVALEPDNADAQYLLGQNLEHSGDSWAAIQHWKAALQADPNHSQALYNLARSLDKIHDPDAKRYQDRFEVLQKNQQIADRVSELGNFALEAANAQNWPQALEQMNEAIQLCGACPQSAHLHKNLGLFYGRTGNISEAKKELRTALQLTPEDADAKNALAAIERANGEQVK
jgi:tetratricopeptide (TPR) repeat protein